MRRADARGVGSRKYTVTGLLRGLSTRGLLADQRLPGLEGSEFVHHGLFFADRGAKAIKETLV